MGCGGGNPPPFFYAREPCMLDISEKVEENSETNNMMLLGINLAPVVVAAIAAMIIGMAWFSKGCCGKIMGDKPKPKGGTLVAAFVNSLVSAFVLALFIAELQAVGWQAGAWIGAWVWLGFIATSTMGGVLWDGKSMKWFWTLAIEELIAFAAMGAIIASW